MFRPRTPGEAIDLVSRLLEYTPAARFNPMEACAHAFFNELRLPDAKMPSGTSFPPLFNFTAQGIVAFDHTLLVGNGSLNGLKALFTKYGCK